MKQQAEFRSHSLSSKKVFFFVYEFLTLTE